MRLVVGALILLLAPAGAWTQANGDAGRTGTLDPLPVLDVVASFRYAPEGFDLPNEFSNARGAFYATPEGLAVASRFLDNGTCVQSLVPYDALVPLHRYWPCTGTESFIGYDPHHDRLLLGIQSDNAAGLVKAIDLVGTVAWTFSPDVLAGAGADPPVLTGSIQTIDDWDCVDAVIRPDRPEALIPCHRQFQGPHILTLVDLTDGTTIWSATVDYNDQPGRDAFGIIPDVEDDPGKELDAAGAVVGAAGTDDGYIVTFASVTTEPYTAWLDPDGQLVGIQSYASHLYRQSLVDPDDYRSPVDYQRSATAATDGLRGALATEDGIYLISPANAAAQFLPILPPDGLPPSSFWASPTWIGQRIIVPYYQSLIVVDAVRGAPEAEWRAPDGGHIEQVAQDGHDVAVLTARPTAGGVRADLFVVDGQTGATRQRIPLPAELMRDDAFFAARFVPYDGGILVFEDGGHGVVLAGSTARATVAASNAAPRIGEEVTIGGDHQEAWIAWGDGALTRGLPAAHAYAAAGLREIRVTTVHADGTTSTEVLHVEVGGTPPTRLNWLQQRFTAENQDTTWGVIGVALVAGGAVVGLLARRRGRDRIAVGLRKLRAIHAGADADRLAALRDLQEWHRGQEDRLLRGRLTEDQFRVLENRGARLLRSLADGALEPVADALDARVRRRLEAAYQDGFVEASEVAALRRDVAALRLPGAKRRVVEGVLDAWS